MKNKDLKKIIANHRPYSIGQRFRDPISIQEYILVKCAPKQVVLISLRNGNQWSAAIQVDDPHHITDEEFEKLNTFGWPEIENDYFDIRR